MGLLTKTNLIIFLLLVLIFLLAHLFFDTQPTKQKIVSSFNRFSLANTKVSPEQEQEQQQQSIRRLPSEDIDSLHYENNLLILYNRIPKTASTSLMSVMYSLHTRNKFNLAFVNVSSLSHRFTWLDQYKFALNISHWQARKPALYHGHFPFLDFTRFQLQQPIYINVVREPLERFVSHYYFIRYGDTYLPNKIRQHQGDTRTFDDCVLEKGSGCNPKRLWIQIPYFCGSDPECWDPGNKKALQKAKANVVERYFLVGVTDQIGRFVELLEKSIPRIFESATHLFTKDGGVRIRKTKVKKPLQQTTLDYFRKSKIWQMENEFYNFVKRRFDYIYKMHLSSKGRYQVSYIKLKP